MPDANCTDETRYPRLAIDPSCARHNPCLSTTTRDHTRDCPVATTHTCSNFRGKIIDKDNCVRPRFVSAQAPCTPPHDDPQNRNTTTHGQRTDVVLNRCLPHHLLLPRVPDCCSEMWHLGLLDPSISYARQKGTRTLLAYGHGTGIPSHVMSPWPRSQILVSV